jgi:hypothetical protein
MHGGRSGSRNNGEYRPLRQRCDFAKKSLRTPQWKLNQFPVCFDRARLRWEVL